jgi:hypothetical protein
MQPGDVVRQIAVGDLNSGLDHLNGEGRTSQLAATARDALRRRLPGRHSVGRSALQAALGWAHDAACCGMQPVEGGYHVIPFLCMAMQVPMLTGVAAQAPRAGART